MRYYCPRCWKDFGADIERCPACGLNIADSWKGMDYVQKLILALNHPEPGTPIRAAWILGQIRDDRAVEPLISLIERTQDVYVACAAVRALGLMGTPRAYQFLKVIKDTHRVGIVRSAAAAFRVQIGGVR